MRMATSTADPQRLRYFPRQLLTAPDLLQEQDYRLAQLRRHNRLLHGWGVVAGCLIRGTLRDWTVLLEPGFVLSPQGDEIAVEDPVLLDLSQQTPEGYLVTASGGPGDLWYAG